MRLKFSEFGLVEGGIECSFATLNTFGSPESETVFDLADWIRKQFLELRVLAEKSGKRGGKEDRFIWIGETKNPFAQLSSDKSKFFVKYFHPKYVTRQGFSTGWKNFESSNLETITNHVIAKAHGVENLEG